jgi:alpha-mannosidase
MRGSLQNKYAYFGLLVLFLTACGPDPASAQRVAGETSSFAWAVAPFYQYRSDGKPGRAIRILFKDSSYKGSLTVKVTCGQVSESTSFKQNSRENILLLPQGVGVDSAATANITISAGEQQHSGSIHIPRKRYWTVYVYPHSHLDIGYTGLPEEVKKIQFRNIDVGIDIAEKTQHYPEGAKFVWNPEATWVVKSYLEQASPAQKQKFINAVRKGWVQLDAGHSNSNTSTCSDEELLHFFRNVSTIENATGTSLTSMVQVDVPGAAWGLITAAAQFGINRFISFPNYFDVRRHWEHKPFYWLAPDGKTKMLFLQGAPYGIGYTIKGNKYGLGKLQRFTTEYDRVSTEAPLNNFLHQYVADETDKLEKAGSPYDILALTWSMADNCVIDADLPEAVKMWNQQYAYPKLVISGSKGILDAYEKKFASIIPTMRGDFTEFWTNGLGSDAHSVGVGREAKEELVQAEILSVLLSKENQAAGKLEAAWENQLLSAEHTWGAQDPRSLLAQQVEKMKSGYFTDSKKQSEQLVSEALAPFIDTTQPTFSVVNTLSWERSGIITLSPAQSRFGEVVVDDKNNRVKSQRLSTGELIFYAEHIPALGSRIYKLVAGKAMSNGGLVAGNNGLRNEIISLELNSITGNIRSIKSMQSGYEYVDSSKEVNSYHYVTGVYNGQSRPSSPATANGISVRIKENGPLLVSLVVSATAAGVNSLLREVRLYHASPTVELINTFDKIHTRNKEAIHFGFGFNIPGGKGNIDMPWSIVTPNDDQLNGANKNWFSFQRWVDISNRERGITWTSIQSPLIEWGALSGNILDGARQFSLWQKEVPQSSTIYSWPLNNHWDTNFPLAQGGAMKQQYYIRLHDAYDVVAANRFGMEMHRRLIVVQAKQNILAGSFIKINNPKLAVSAIKRTRDEKAILVRLRSVSPKQELLKLEWPSQKPREVIICNADEQPKEDAKSTIEVEPYGMVNLRLVF